MSYVQLTVYIDTEKKKRNKRKNAKKTALTISIIAAMRQRASATAKILLLPTKKLTAFLLTEIIVRTALHSKVDFKVERDGDATMLTSSRAIHLRRPMLCSCNNLWKVKGKKNGAKH